MAADQPAMPEGILDDTHAWPNVGIADRLELGRSRRDRLGMNGIRISDAEVDTDGRAAEVRRTEVPVRMRFVGDEDPGFSNLEFGEGISLGSLDAEHHDRVRS